MLGRVEQRNFDYDLNFEIMIGTAACIICNGEKSFLSAATAYRKANLFVMVLIKIIMSMMQLLLICHLRKAFDNLTG